MGDQKSRRRLFQPAVCLRAILLSLPILGGLAVSLPARAEVLWLEAERFTDIGTWTRDAQFIDQMGSSYLLAGGLGHPVEDAVTWTEIGAPGVYRLWVRAKNWVPEHSPGRFQVLVGGRLAEPIFGTLKSSDWLWQDGGTFALEQGKIEVRVRDLTGYYGRCDAVVLSDEPGYRPPDDKAALAAERIRRGGTSREVAEMPKRDVVVVGGGLAGISAALAAARHGASVYLVQNRPALGGNDSPEIGVGAQGCIPAGFDPGETGIPKEICSEEDRPRRSFLVTREKNIALYLNVHATGVRMADKTRIKSVEAVHTITGDRTAFPGDVFIDCTGDGCVGAAAGADLRQGREARSEFGESHAPEKADRYTLGTTLTYRGMPEGRLWIGPSAPPVRSYAAPSWARKFPAGIVDTKFSARGEQWWLEWGGMKNTIDDAELIRDELLRIVYGLWAATPQNGPHELEWVQYVGGKRESRRLIGDYIMTERDVLADQLFPDRVAVGGWSIDLHPPEGFYAYKQIPLPKELVDPRYSIPFRSLYSRNIANLMMAGRDISVSHVALGSTRVMVTCATQGQAAGTAAALCAEHKTTPRGVYQDHIRQLQQQLLKDGAYLTRLKNEDSQDLALAARVSASSCLAKNGYRPENVVNGFNREEGGAPNAWAPDPAAKYPQWIELDFGSPVVFNTVHVTFQHPDLAAKAYRLEAWVQDTWQPVSSILPHPARFRRSVHGFAAVTAAKLRIVIQESAVAKEPPTLCEIRVYNETAPHQGVREAG